MSFWLSHHYGPELHRTYALAGVRVCARCLGTYPTVLLALGAQQVFGAPLSNIWDLWLGLGLLAPALIDWAFGQLQPERGTNLWRSATGVLLGLALGRSLYVHAHRPLPALLLWQAGVVLAVGLPVILLRSRRSKR